MIAGLNPAAPTIFQKVEKMLIKLTKSLWVDPSAVVTVTQKYDFFTPGQTPAIKKQCSVLAFCGNEQLEYLVDEFADTVSNQISIALGHS